MKVQAFPTIQTVAVEKWDFGGIDHLSLDALRPLSETYLNVHQMVFCARLHGKLKILHAEKCLKTYIQFRKIYFRFAATSQFLG